MKLIHLLPLLVFAVIGVVAFLGLSRDQSILPSMMIDRPVPEFELAALPELGDGLTSDHLIGEVSMVNFFGSWCAACRIEHPLLLDIAARGEVPIYGVNFMETADRGAAWLDRYGNPYSRVGNDETSRFPISLGVTGAPETFIVDAEGRIRFRHVGPITPDLWRRTLRPMIEELQGQAENAS